MCRLIISGILACTILAGPARALETVHLASGRVLQASEVRFQEDSVEIELVGGGSLVLPRSLVQEVTGPADPKPAQKTAPLASLDFSPSGTLYWDLIQQTGRRHGVDPVLVAAVVQVESAWNADAVSSAGACGLMQLLPETARIYGVEDPFDPTRNLEAGVRHLRRLLDRYENDAVLALAAYNAGEGRVDQYRGVPPFEETRRYVRKVTDLFQTWRDPTPFVQ